MQEIKRIEIEFDEDLHRYSLNGIILPSVTQIMKPMTSLIYSDISPMVMSEAASRGTRVHEQISNYVRYGIFESDEDTAAYLAAFGKFLDDYHPYLLESEYRTYHKHLLYAGTIDLIGYVHPDDHTGVDVIDLKCTAAFHRTLLETQVSAYGECLKSHGTEVRHYYGLQLLKTGKYRLELLKDGFKTFLHSMALYNAIANDQKGLSACA